MDASNDLILSAMKGPYEWSALRTFVNSVHRSGFRGRKVMLVSGITLEVLLQLEIAGWEVINYTIPPGTKPFGSYCSERFWPANDFLKYAEDFRYIIWTDWKDVVMQTDPSKWLENNLGLHTIIGCSEGMLIKEEFYNNGWLKQAAPDDATYQLAREHPILCAGTLAGEGLAMRFVLNAVYDVLSTSPNKPDYEGGVSPLIDQGILNYLLRVRPFEAITRVPEWSEGFCATVNWYIVHRWTNRPAPEVRDGVFYPQGKSEPFCIVHQYDRDPLWKAAVEKRYQ